MCARAAEIILIDNIVSVYRSGSDVTMHVIGSSFEVRMQQSEAEATVMDGATVY